MNMPQTCIRGQEDCICGQGNKRQCLSCKTHKTVIEGDSWWFSQRQTMCNNSCKGLSSVMTISPREGKDNAMGNASEWQRQKHVCNYSNFGWYRVTHWTVYRASYKGSFCLPQSSVSFWLAETTNLRCSHSRESHCIQRWHYGGQNTRPTSAVLVWNCLGTISTPEHPRSRL